MTDYIGIRLWLEGEDAPLEFNQVTAVSQGNGHFEVDIYDGGTFTRRLDQVKMYEAFPVEAPDEVCVNEERTVLVNLFADGSMSVALRDEPGDIWGPPISVHRE